MHTMMFGGVLQLDHVRTDNCGQRYTLGRYCIHMHLIGHCADCRVASNAVVEGEAPRLPETVGFSPDVQNYVTTW